MYGSGSGTSRTALSEPGDVGPEVFVAQDTASAGWRHGLPTKAARSARRRRRSRWCTGVQPHSLPWVIPSRAWCRPERDEHGAAGVERLTRVSLLSAEQHGCKGDGGEADRDVDEEDPLPGERIREDAAEEDAGGADLADSQTPRRSRARSLRRTSSSGSRARPGESSRRRGPEWRGSATPAPRQPAEERADREGDQADHEELTAPQQVATRQEKPPKTSA